jgi:hypothetical protein
MAALRRLYTQVHLRDAVLLGILLGGGAWLRFRNLGALSLVVDEGVQALAVEALMAQGRPVLDSGLVYLRGPLYLYVQAALASLAQLNAFWLRVPGAVLGLAAVVPTYVLGRDLSGRWVGLLAAALLAGSAWEVEMSRYARVYIAFQFFFVTSLVFFYRGFLCGRRGARVAFVGTAALAFLTHEQSQVLLTLFLIPMVARSLSAAEKGRIVAWGGLVGAVLLGARQVNGVHLPASMAEIPRTGATVPGGVLEAITTTLGLPPLKSPALGPFWTALEQQPVAVGLILLGGGSAVVALGVRAVRHGGWGRAGGGALLVGAAAMYQLGVALLLFVLYLVFYARGLRVWTDRSLQVAVGAASVCGAGWGAVLLHAPALAPVEVPLVLFEVPAFYKYFLRWLAKGWPVLTVLLAGGSVWLFGRLLRHRSDPAPLFLLGALYVPALASSLFVSYYDIEYTLHLFPVVLLIVSSALWRGALAVAGRGEGRGVRAAPVMVGLGAAVLMLSSPDLRPTAAWAVGARDYRSPRPPVRNVMAYWPYADVHQDLKSPSDFLRRTAGPEDAIVFFGPVHASQIAQYYLGRMDYVLISEELRGAFGVRTADGVVHYTNGCGVLSDPARLAQIADTTAGTTWLIGDRRTTLDHNSYFDSKRLKNVVEAYGQAPTFVARDSITFVARVP